MDDFMCLFWNMYYKISLLDGTSTQVLRHLQQNFMRNWTYSEVWQYLRRDDQCLKIHFLYITLKFHLNNNRTIGNQLCDTVHCLDKTILSSPSNRFSAILYLKRSNNAIYQTWMMIFPFQESVKYRRHNFANWLLIWIWFIACSTFWLPWLQLQGEIVEPCFMFYHILTQSSALLLLNCSNNALDHESIAVLDRFWCRSSPTLFRLLNIHERYIQYTPLISL